MATKTILRRKPRLGQTIRAIRRRHDMTQAELAFELKHVRGFAQAAISRLETDLWLPDAGQMVHLLRALHATEEDSQAVRQLAAALRVRDANG